MEDFVVGNICLYQFIFKSFEANYPKFLFRLVIYMKLRQFFKEKNLKIAKAFIHIEAKLQVMFRVVFEVAPLM